MDYRREIGKLVTKFDMSLRQAACVLGKVRSLLVVFPALRIFTDALAAWVQTAHDMGYDFVSVVPSDVKAQARECKQLLQDWSGRHFDTAVTRQVASDASDHELGGIDLQCGRIVHDYFMQFLSLHINAKELMPSEYTVLSLAKPHDTVRLLVDNSTAFFYLLKGGGRLRHLNDRIRMLFLFCIYNNIELLPEWVPTDEMPADAISRWGPDYEDYSLSHVVTRLVFSHFQAVCRPSVDLFAIYLNSKCPE